MISLSVLTVSLNSVATIERTIKSVLNCAHYVDEYIIIDGGSSDATVDVLNRYRNEISEIVVEQDGGISEAFNKGIRRCTGTYILILNADDILFRQGVKALFPVLASGFDIILPLHTVLEAPGHRLYRSDPEQLPMRNTVFHPGSVIKKSFYDSVGLYDESLKYAMDYDWFARAFRLFSPNYSHGNFQLVGFSVGGKSSQLCFRGLHESFQIRRKYFGARFPTSEVLRIILRGSGRALAVSGLSGVMRTIRGCYLKKAFGGRLE